MKITTLALMMVFALGCTYACHAETTEEMVSSCKTISTTEVISGGKVSLPQDFNSGVCWGAFATIQTVIRAVDPNTLRTFFYSCPPTDATRTQLIQIFLTYAQAHPERYQEDYFPVALTAISKAFPCPGN